MARMAKEAGRAQHERSDDVADTQTPTQKLFRWVPGHAFMNDKLLSAAASDPQPCHEWYHVGTQPAHRFCTAVGPVHACGPRCVDHTFCWQDWDLAAAVVPVAPCMTVRRNVVELSLKCNHQVVALVVYTSQVIYLWMQNTDITKARCKWHCTNMHI